MDCNMDSNLQMAPTFEEIWKQDIMPLKGKSLYGYSGHKNIITDVNWNGVTRISKNGKSSIIPIEVFRSVVQELIRKGVLTRTEINTRFPIRASSGIVLILSQAKCFKLEAHPLRLVYIKSH